MMSDSLVDNISTADLDRVQESSLMCEISLGSTLISGTVKSFLLERGFLCELETRVLLQDAVALSTSSTSPCYRCEIMHGLDRIVSLYDCSVNAFRVQDIDVARQTCTVALQFQSKHQ